MKTDSFQSCGHCWVFQICWHIECSTFSASSFRICNGLTGFPSLPLSLFVLILCKTHLTSHARMSGSRWVITPSWLSGSWRSFLYHSSVYSCHLFLVSSASLRSIPFLSFIEPIFAWNIPLVSVLFFKKSLVFPILEKEMATHSSVLAWRIPGKGEPGGLPSLGSHRIKHDWGDLAAAAAVFPVLFFPSISLHWQSYNNNQGF